MNTSFALLDKQFELVRYPAELQHQSWQAWDSADELLIEHVESEYPDYTKKSVLILNDDFGALGAWFAHCHPAWISDSYVARRSCQINLENNQIDEGTLKYLDSLSFPELKAELVLLKVPKTTALLEHQLIQLQDVVTPDTVIIAAGKAKAIQKSTLGLFEKYLGATHTSLAKKKSRLIFCQPSGDKQHKSPYPTIWQTDDKQLTLANHANVFARQQLDIGARLLLEHLPDCSNISVLDLGCGNGVLGLSVLKRHPDAKVVFVDESFMAVESARENVLRNLPEQIDNCRFLQSNCLDEFPSLNLGGVDLVLCNPPFHQQNAITDHIAYQMFKDAKKYLHRGGELRIIGNRHLDYPQKLKRLFGGYRVVASDRKFSILSTIKR